MRGVVYGFSILLASLAVVRMASATEQPAIHFGPDDIADGKTLTLPDGAKAGIFPGALASQADVTWTVSEGTVPTLPSGRKLLGSVYRLTISGPTALNPDLKRPIAVAIPFGSSYWIRQVWQYDRSTTQWTPLRTTLNSTHTLGQAAPKGLDLLLAVLEDRHQQEGGASWYCRLHCSSRYPTLHGTSNDFTVGSTVQVRSLETGKTVNVKIVSGWGQPAGRIIDLSWAAYHTLGASNAGVTAVNVSLPTPKVLGVSTTAVPVSKTETIPALTIEDTHSFAFPNITPRPFYVYDQGTGQMLATNQADTPVPLASLTKLMTAAVFLDTNTSLKNVFTYSTADQTPYAYLQVNPGETMLVRDLFYSMLVGSANNGATALVRSTGLSREEFVQRMNAKAQAWGLSTVKFTDVSGLDPGNLASAHDEAIMAGKIFHEYEPVRYVTTRREYTFTTINTGVTHTLKSTDKILGSGMLPTTLGVTGGKTGFLDEAKYTYVLRVTDKGTGAQVVVALMGSDTSAQRFTDAAAIVNWAFHNFRWRG